MRRDVKRPVKIEILGVKGVFVSSPRIARTQYSVINVIAQSMDPAHIFIAAPFDGAVFSKRKSWDREFAVTGQAGRGQMSIKF